jgi:transcriptional regulator with XRE-family HTH domain
MQHLEKMTNDYRQRMGVRLRSLREKLGETQSQFAQRLGVIKLSMLKYEAGTTCPSAEQLHNLELTGVDATYVAFGHPSLANSQARKNFAAALAWVKRESKISSLNVSDEHLVDAAWFMFCKLNDAAVSDDDAMVDEAKVALKSFETISDGNG